SSWRWALIEKQPWAPSGFRWARGILSRRSTGSSRSSRPSSKGCATPASARAFREDESAVSHATKKGRVLVAMSGGVDSSVAAALLVEQGYECIGVTMQLWPEDLPLAHESGCCSLSAVEDARRVANKLGIPYYVLNFAHSFAEEVIERFAEEYLRGRTPNPCIVCNEKVKFGTFLQKALELGCDYVATGHYARV